MSCIGNAEVPTSGGAEREQVPTALRYLFAAHTDRAHDEQAVEQLATEMIRWFSKATEVMTTIEPGSLALRFMNTKVPDRPAELVEYFAYLADNVVAHSTHTASPLCLGHMTPPTPHFMPQLARLMTALNQNLVRADASKAFTPYERETIAMLHRLVYDLDDTFYARHMQNSASTLGMIVSGGTLANLAALWCARNACLPPDGHFAGIDCEGLPEALQHYGYADAVIFGSSSMHYSFAKAAGILGVGRSNLIRVPADRTDRIELTELCEAVAECPTRRRRIIAIVGVAGTTDAGAVDPLVDLAEIAHSAGAHFHVDAAWGGPLLFSNRHRHKLRGIERADSVTLDGHKQLYLPTGTGVLLFRDPTLAKGIEQEAHYIVRQGSPDLGKRSIEGSRPGSALFLHAALHIIGKTGYEFLINDGIRQARYAAASIRARPELELLLEPELNILLYRYIPEPLRSEMNRRRLTATDNHLIDCVNERLHKAQRSAGHTLVSRTTSCASPYGRDVPIVALRAVFANPLTTERNIDEVLDDQIAIASRLTV